MVLFNKPKEAPEHCEVYMYSGQHFIQNALVVLALACIPVMLLGKPLKIMKQRKLANVSENLCTEIIIIICTSQSLQ